MAKVSPLDRGVFALAMLGLSWLGMMAIHELGHVAGAWVSGGTVRQVIMPAMGFSRTDVHPNPSPGVVVWAGPILGVLLPLAGWVLFLGVRARRLAQLHFIEKPLRFFMGFCLVLNGAYLAFGSFARIGDCAVILDAGTSAWTMWLFGGVTIPAGFVFWHSLGPQLGLSQLQRRPTAWIAFGAFILIDTALYLIAEAITG